jgi:organic radical activating enzyme
MSLFDFFRPAKPLPAESLRYQSPPTEEKPYRLHLRLNTDGSGLLIINAATVLHLNPTAAEYAYHFIKGTPPEETAKQTVKRYRVKKEQALADYRQFCERIETLVRSEDLDPVTYLGFERIAPHSTALTAPLRLDCALTYRLPEGISANDAPVKRVDRELDTAEWTTILSKAWDAGIPHVTFTGGEPTLRSDLPELIARAEKLGMVSGLLSDGLKLADAAYRNRLLQTGLDHLLFLLQPANEKSWQALSAILPEDLYTTVHLTLTAENATQIPATIERLSQMPVNALSLSSTREMDEILQKAREQAAETGIPLNWDLPVPYSAHNPVALETVAEHIPLGAGNVWLYIEPDGDVLPAQGMATKILGNALKDDWNKIWQNR